MVCRYWLISCIIASSIPWGGHLSPLLFIIFVNSLSNYLLYSKVHLFADDIKLFLKVNSFTDFLLLQLDLESFFDWDKQLNLSLNTNRYYVISFSRKLSPISHTYHLEYFLFNCVFIINNLRIYFSPTLFFEFHINNMVGRILRVLVFIKRNTANFTSISCLCVLFVFSSIYIEVWGGSLAPLSNTRWAPNGKSPKHTFILCCFSLKNWSLKNLQNEYFLLFVLPFNFHP